MVPAPAVRAAPTAAVYSEKAFVCLSARSNIDVAAECASPDHARVSGMVLMLVLILDTALLTALPAFVIAWPVNVRESGFQRSKREREGNKAQKILSKLSASPASVTS